MNIVDSYLNKITMYRLTVLSLGILAIASILAAFFGKLPYSALQLTVSLIILVAAARISNAAFAIFAKAAATPESAYITGLILFFVFTPMQSVHDGVILALFAAAAMLSKYLIAPAHKHIFNPAAVAAFLASVLGIGISLWWVGTPILFPVVAVAGFLVIRKLRRAHLFWSFALTATAVFIIRAVVAGSPVGSAFMQLLFSWPLLFFGAFMLTEPQTTPPTRNDRIIYGILIGVIFSLSFRIGPVSATPQFALLVGNIFAYAVSFRKRITLTLKEILPLTRDMYEFVFVADQPFAFKPGQYAEWTLPHRKADTRSIRRFFTIASAPEDPFVRVGMRVPVEGSSFKKSLKELPIGSKLSTTGVSGEFNLPQDPNQKIAAIAGGIGITPFMSMFRHLAERHEHRDIMLIYAATSPLDFAYQKEIDSFADSIGLRVIYLPTDFPELTSWTGKSGFVTDSLVRSDVPDFTKRIWYFSGPPGMVDTYKGLLKKMGIPKNHIKTDYFPGL